MTITELIKQSYDTALLKGWHEGDLNVPEKLALIHSEVSEALEDYRSGHMELYYEDNGKPASFGVELADAVIRIADLCGRMGIDLESLINTKHEYNKTRPFRHGGKKA